MSFVYSYVISSCSCNACWIVTFASVVVTLDGRSRVQIVVLVFVVVGDLVFICIQRSTLVIVMIPFVETLPYMIAVTKKKQNNNDDKSSNHATFQWYLPSCNERKRLPNKKVTPLFLWVSSLIRSVHIILGFYCSFIDLNSYIFWLHLLRMVRVILERGPIQKSRGTVLHLRSRNSTVVKSSHVYYYLFWINKTVKNNDNDNYSMKGVNHIG